MLVRIKQGDKGTAANAFTLAEVMVSLFIFGSMTGGLIYGYVQANRMAEWSAMSLAAQSIASQGVEQTRCAVWNQQLSSTNTGPGTGQELLPGTNTYTNFSLSIPSNGNLIYVTNVVKVTTYTTSPKVMQIRSDCGWEFVPAESGTNRVFYTNTVVTLRAPDQ